MKVKIEKDGKRIRVEFPYNPDAIAKVKAIPGRSFNDGRSTGTGPHWRLPLQLESCYALREAFGDALVIGPALREWAWAEVNKREELYALINEDDAELQVLPERLPALAESLRDYQRIGARFLAATEGSLLADQPGLGKTRETVAGITEAGLLDSGPHLVVAPKSGLDTAWRAELEAIQDLPVHVAGDGRRKREQLLSEFYEAQNGWLVINPAMIAYRREYDSSGCPDHDGSEYAAELRKCDHCEANLVSDYPLLHQIKWASVTMDECHAGAIRNPETLVSKALHGLQISGIRVALSGTPMKGRALDLWGTLHWLDPATFSSKWNWAEHWCEIEEEEYHVRGGKGRTRTSRKPRGILPEKADAFAHAHAPYLLRRTKKEVAPELPDKTYVDRWIDITGEQNRIYREMEADAEARLSEEDSVSATSILAEFTRLKQFASAVCEAREGEIYPTGRSNKLDALMTLLDEHGIRREGEEGDSKVIVFSQFSRMVDMVSAELEKAGIETEKITGGTTRKGERKRIQDQFQSDSGPRVLAMTTQTGGLSVTLDRADTVVFLDEMWSPSDMEQAEDRVHRISRVHNVTIYKIRSKDTIEEYVASINLDKASIHKEVLSIRERIRKGKANG